MNAVNEKTELLTMDGYFRRFYEVLQERQCLHVKAYREVEKEHQRYFGRKRYDSYGSFRVGKWRYNKVRKRKYLNR